jgi:hypothetical protein
LKERLAISPQPIVEKVAARQPPITMQQVITTRYRENSRTKDRLLFHQSQIIRWVAIKVANNRRKRTHIPEKPIHVSDATWPYLARGT